MRQSQVENEHYSTNVCFLPVTARMVFYLGTAGVDPQVICKVMI